MSSKSSFSGVGKSTWINAFVNYLNHLGLQDALNADKLSFIAPFAFLTYSTNDEGDLVDLRTEFGFKKGLREAKSRRALDGGLTPLGRLFSPFFFFST